MQVINSSPPVQPSCTWAPEANLSTMSFVANIHHVSLNVADIDRSHVFYVDTLGLKVLDRPDLGFAGR